MQASVNQAAHHSPSISPSQAPTQLSWDRIDAQEELDSYEVTMHNNRGLGRRRVPKEFSEIGRTDGSMTELVRISRNKALLHSSVGKVIPHLYD